MRFSSIISSLLVALGISMLPGVAAAQAAGLVVTMEPFGPEDGAHQTSPVVTDTTRPIGPYECGTMMLWTVSGATAGLQIDVWSSDAATGNCWQVDARNPMSGATSACTHRFTLPEMSISGTPEEPQEFLVSDLLGDLCDGTTTSTRYLWVFTTMTAESPTAPAVTYLASPIVMTYDGTRPTAPTAPAEDGGESSVTIEWTPPTTEMNLFGSRVYLDPTPCVPATDGAMGTDAGTGMLMPGGEPRGTPVATASGNTSRVSISDDDLGWADDTEFTESATLYVTVVDLARNESVLSNAICVQHVARPGVLTDLCADFDGGLEACRQHYRGCTVSEPGTPSGASSSLLAACVAITLFAVRSGRRRR